MSADGLAEVLAMIQARGDAAQVCVLRHGRVVLDRTFNCAPDSLFWLLSTSKPFVALLVHLLAERGELGLDEPVAAYWPEFGRNGKAGITVRQVLRHRAGVPVARSLLHDALAMGDWARSIRQLEAARPRWPAGEVPAYHILSYGFILGELVRRVTGVGVDEFLRTEFLLPLELRDTYLGLPPEAWPRHVPMRGRSVEARIRQGWFNRRAIRSAVIPAAGVSTTARDLARFYQTLLRGGAPILKAETLAGARTPSSDGERDRFLDRPIRWSEGFQLGGPDQERRNPPMGRTSARETFGHNGSYTCLAWADPTRDLVFTYLTNTLRSDYEGPRHQRKVSDALLAACPP